MAETMHEAISHLEQDIIRWREDLLKFEAMGEKALTEQISIWMTEAQKIVDAYRRHA